MPQLLAPETAAPDFTLRVTPDQYVSLSELRGWRVILSFYPADWSPVCGDQITLCTQVREEFHKYDAEIIGISVDSAWCHQATQRITTSTFHFSPIFIPKARLRRSTVSIANRTGYVSAPYL